MKGGDRGMDKVNIVPLSRDYGVMWLSNTFVTYFAYQVLEERLIFIIPRLKL